MPTPWSNIEVELILADYFSMLADELAGRPVNKTLHRNRLLEILGGRSEGSIEFKHQNISAVLIKLGLPYIRGYKPKWNFQRILADKVTEYVTNQKLVLEDQFHRFAESGVSRSLKVDFNVFLDTPPREQMVVSEPAIEYAKRPIKINYLQREQANQALGVKGEKLVLQYEKWRLIKHGKEALANRIEWISQHDDSAGFDILSKETNGTDRFIEVKTTKLSKQSPIFFTKNEYDFSLRHEEKFYLYRVFNFSEQPRMFNFRGNFDQFCYKEAIQYRGYF